MFSKDGLSLTGWTIVVTPVAVELSEAPDNASTSYTFGASAEIPPGGWALVLGAPMHDDSTEDMPPAPPRAQTPISAVLAPGFDPSAVVDYASGPTGPPPPSAEQLPPGATLSFPTPLSLPFGGGFVYLLRPDQSLAANISYPRLMPGQTYGLPSWTGLEPVPPKIHGGVVEYSHLSVPTPAAPNAQPLSAAADAPAIGFVSADFFVPIPVPAAVDLPIAATAGPVLEGRAPQLTLHYRAMFGPEHAVTMDVTTTPLKSGAPATYSALIPASAIGAGQMVRWAVTAEYPGSPAQPSRLPSLPRGTAAPVKYAAYFGTVGDDGGAGIPGAESLPRMQLFCDREDLLLTKIGARCGLAFQGRFYDNVRVGRRGQSTAWWPKPKLTVRPPARGRRLVYAPGQPPSKQLDLHSMYIEDGTPTYQRSVLAFRTLAIAGVPSFNTDHVLVFLNSNSDPAGPNGAPPAPPLPPNGPIGPGPSPPQGRFYGLYSWHEKLEAPWLLRHGWDPRGETYKAEHPQFSNLSPFPAASASNFERMHAFKKMGGRDLDDLTSIIDFAAGLNQTGPALASFLFNSLDVPQIINEMAAQALMNNPDRCTKNYFLYKDFYTQEWRKVPWDVEQGFPWAPGTATYCLETCDAWASPLYCTHTHPQDPKSVALFMDPSFDSSTTQNHLIDAIIYGCPATRAMYLRRLQTLLDGLLVNNAVAVLANATAAMIAPAADRDNVTWQGGSIADGVAQLTGVILRRTRQLADVYGPSPGNGLLPGPQRPAAGRAIDFGAITPGLADSPWSIQLRNALGSAEDPTAAVDLSGWVIGGAVTHVMAPGTVLPGGSTLIVVADLAAFRARPGTPGAVRFVQGGATGAPVVGAAITLSDGGGALIAKSS